MPDTNVGRMYTLKETQQMANMQRFGLSTKGSLDEIRRRMKVFLRVEPAIYIETH